jgi:hypothetical protein
MRIVAIILSVLRGSCSVALAQGNPSGRGSITGDPADSTSNPSAEPPATTGSNSSKSGSGTSTSGGKDHNMDGGRDKMPESNMAVKPSPGKPEISQVRLENKPRQAGRVGFHDPFMSRL